MRYCQRWTQRWTEGIIAGPVNTRLHQKWGGICFYTHIIELRFTSVSVNKIQQAKKPGIALPLSLFENANILDTPASATAAFHVFFPFQIMYFEQQPSVSISKSIKVVFKLYFILIFVFEMFAVSVFSVGDG